VPTIFSIKQKFVFQIDKRSNQISIFNVTIFKKRNYQFAVATIKPKTNQDATV